MKQRSRNYYLLMGLGLANAFAMIVIGISKFIVDKQTPGHGDSSTFIFSDFVIVPIAMGLITAWFWRNTTLSGWQYFWFSILNGLLGIVFSYIFLGEGSICLVIVSPLVFAFILIGAFVGKLVFEKDNNTLNVSVFSLLFLIFVADTLSEHNYVNLVSDTVVIHARPDEIWKHVVAFDNIKEPPHYWLFRVGMPCPVASTVDGYYQGAGRKCIFSNGYTFDEKMTIYKPGEDLVFDITHQPRDPEIMGHIDLLRGEFSLKDNGDGTTTLTGNSWYRLYVFPTWYYDIWAKSLVRNVHIRVMDHIKKLSEQK